MCDYYLLTSICEKKFIFVKLLEAAVWRYEIINYTAMLQVNRIEIFFCYIRIAQ